MIMMEAVRVRLVFEDWHMLSKSKKKEELQRSWVLLKPETNTICDLASHIFDTFRLHRTCPNGIILSMDGFVLPPFESRSILKDKDIVCVKRRGSISTASKVAMLTSAPHGHQYVELPKLLAHEKLQKETRGYKTMSEEDNVNQFEDTLYVEPKPPRIAVSKKRKASKKLKDSRKKIKLSSGEKLAVTPEEPVEKNGSFQGCSIYHQLSLINKDNGKSSNSSSQPDNSKSIGNQKQSNEINEPVPNEARFCQPQDDGKGNVDMSNSLCRTEKLPSRSARRKKAKRQWLREQLKLEKEKLHQSPLSEKDGQELPVKHNRCIVSDVHQKPVEESDAEDDIVPVEIRPGHIRFEPLSKDQAVSQNQFPVETFRWNGITNKKKGQKWGREKTTFHHKGDDYKHSSQECSRIQNAEEKEALMPVDFDKLISYASLPKEGDVIAYRLIELSSSWTPEISSFRVGKISWYDPESNRIGLEPVLEYPFDFEKKIDEVSTLQSDSSPYGEDGSLEIDYSSLVDVRMVKHRNSELANAVASGDVLVDPTKATKRRNNELVGDQTAMQSCQPDKESEGHIPAKENGEVNVWDEINEALTAKKAKLSLEKGCSKEENSGTRSWSHRALRCSALGPTMAFLRAQNGLKETSQQ